MGGAFVKNFVYVPAYYDGSSPFGVWTGSAITIDNNYLYYQDLNYDVGMVNVLPLNGAKLVNQVGGEGYAHDGSAPVTIWGYPAAAPYNGQRPYNCQNPPLYTFQGRPIAGCSMTGGASGGPWLVYVDPNTGLGYTNGVTSTNVPQYPGYIASPYFTGWTVTLFNKAEDL